MERINMFNENQYKKMVVKVLKNKYSNEKFILDKFIDGTINHVYSARSEKRDIVIRINHNFKYSDFEKEKWAFGQIKKQGVPVPTFVYLDTSRKVILRDYVIYKRVIGKPLSSYFKDFHITKDDIKKLIPVMRETGFYMSKIHNVKMDSFGYLRKNVDGYHGISHSLQDSIMPRAVLFRMAEDGVIKKDFVNQITKEITWGAVNFKADPVLLHLDLHASNLIVDDSLKIKAFVDMENAMAGDPLMEFARLNRFYYKNPELFEAVKDGYENKKIFTSDYKEKIRVYAIKFGSDLLPFYYKRNDMKWVKQLENYVMHLLKGKGV
ncbi:aminoglycoside phosphotransferase family protein [bacterium]|nr:aminoglycoside phosphotransferase family protein [bacterium]